MLYTQFVMLCPQLCLPCARCRPSTTDEPNILRGYERMSPGELESIGIGSDIGINWGEALHSALMPMTPAMSLSSLSDGEIVAMVMQMADTMNDSD